MTAKKSEDNYYRREQLQALAREKFPPLFVLEAEDGTQFFVDNPNTRSDELIEELKPLEVGDGDLVGMAKACIGHDKWDAFKAAGGQAWMFGWAMNEEMERLQAKKPGSDIPTR